MALRNSIIRNRRLHSAHRGSCVSLSASVIHPALHCVHARGRRVAITAHANAGSTVLALDFDGVVVDSVGESAISAWSAACKRWPDVFASATDSDKARVVECMRRLRPVIETGFENLVQARALHEQIATEEQMLSDWETILQQCMFNWGEERAELVQAFGAERDQWIENDLDGWLHANSMFTGVPEALHAALQRSDLSVHIVTTKQAHFTQLLLNKVASIDFPEEKIHSTTVSATPKTEVLRVLQQQHKPDASSHMIVEDKLSTLHKVNDDPELVHWSLLFATWGYCTQEEVEQVEHGQCGRVKPIALDDFNNKLLRNL